MTSKLALHCQQGIPWWFARFLTDSGAAWANLMDPGDAEPMPEFPGVRWIIRFYEDEGTAKAEVLAGTSGAWARYQRLENTLRKRPWLATERFYLEHMNEPSNAGILSTREGREALDAFTAEYTYILWEQLGIRSVGYCLGVGHPEPEHVVQIFPQGMAALMACQGMWSLHEYGWPTMQTGAGSYCLRYRQTVQALKDAGATDIPPLAITECGIDKLIAGEIGGWQVVNNDPQWYVRDQLAWYDAELARDDYVVCATVFTASAEATWRVSQCLC